MAKEQVHNRCKENGDRWKSPEFLLDIEIDFLFCHVKVNFKGAYTLLIISKQSRKLKKLQPVGKPHKLKSPHLNWILQLKKWKFQQTGFLSLRKRLLKNFRSFMIFSSNDSFEKVTRRLFKNFFLREICVNNGYDFECLRGTSWWKWGSYRFSKCKLKKFMLYFQFVH